MKFVRPEHRANIIVHSDPDVLLSEMRGYRALVAEKWVDRLKEKGY
jgi:hypothetical protein